MKEYIRRIGMRGKFIYYYMMYNLTKKYNYGLEAKELYYELSA